MVTPPSAPSTTPPVPGLAVGDTVTWTHVTMRGPSIGFTTRESKIIELFGGTVVVKYRGKRILLGRDRVRKLGQTTELTEIVENLSTQP